MRKPKQLELPLPVPRNHHRYSKLWSHTLEIAKWAQVNLKEPGKFLIYDLSGYQKDLFPRMLLNKDGSYKTKIVKQLYNHLRRFQWYGRLRISIKSTGFVRMQISLYPLYLMKSSDIHRI